MHPQSIQHKILRTALRFKSNKYHVVRHVTAKLQRNSLHIWPWCHFKTWRQRGTFYSQSCAWGSHFPSSVNHHNIRMRGSNNRHAVTEGSRANPMFNILRAVFTPKVLGFFTFSPKALSLVQCNRTCRRNSTCRSDFWRRDPWLHDIPAKLRVSAFWCCNQSHHSASAWVPKDITTFNKFCPPLCENLLGEQDTLRLSYTRHTYKRVDWIWVILQRSHSRSKHRAPKPLIPAPSKTRDI
jgi:hypothetical protein